MQFEAKCSWSAATAWSLVLGSPALSVAQSEEVLEAARPALSKQGLRCLPRRDQAFRLLSACVHICPELPQGNKVLWQSDEGHTDGLG